MNRFHLLLAATTLAATAAHAQQAPTPDAGSSADTAAPASASAPDDGIIVVTATRAATPLDKVPASVSILDKATLDRRQDIGVTEALLRTPGISISRNGGYGTNTSLRIRGGEPDQTVVVIDGVKLTDPSSTDGSFNFTNLLVGDISRIEVLRGPQSTIWGSQAIGGVVNIVTASPSKALEGSFDVEGGSRDTANARVGIGGVTGPLAWRLGGTAFRTGGVSAIAPAYGGQDKDGYRNRTATGRATIDITDGVSADLRGYYSRDRVELDSFAGDSPEYARTREWLGYAGLNAAFLDGRFKNRISYAYTDTNRDNYDPRRARTKTFDAAGRNKRLEYQGSFAIADGYSTVFGVDREHSTFRSVSPPASLATPVPAPARGDATLTGVYAQVNAEPVQGLTLTGGARRDHHNVYGSKTLFSAGGVYKLPTGTLIRASYGEGFKAPSLYQLYSEYGNTALEPVRSHGWEAGVQQRLMGENVDVSATYFDRRTRDQIIYSSCSATSRDPLCFVPGSTTTRRFGFYQNVARAEAHGIEAVATVRPVSGLLLEGNYTWTVSDDRSRGTATFGNWLPRRPRHQANGSADYRWSFGLSTGIAVRWSGKSFDNAANTTVLDDYTLVDVRAELPINATLALFARVENVFDEHYMTAFRYGSIGRSAYAGVRGRF